jgi:hypothetical protein
MAKHDLNIPDFLGVFSSNAKQCAHPFEVAHRSSAERPATDGTFPKRMVAHVVG